MSESAAGHQNHVHAPELALRVDVGHRWQPTFSNPLFVPAGRTVTGGVRASRENGEGSGSVSRPVQFERTFAYESTFSRIGELGTHSLVKRRPHPDDRRKNLVELTTEGRDVRQRATRRVDDAGAGSSRCSASQTLGS